MKTKMFIFVTLVLMALVGSLQAGTIYWDGPVTSVPDATCFWSIPANWDGGSAPISTDSAFIAKDGAHALIVDGDDITVDYLQVGKFNNTTCYLDMTGGTLAANRLYPAFGNYGTAIRVVTNFSGDAVFTTSYTLENRYGLWELNISDNATLTTPSFWAARYGGHAAIHLYGGSLNLTTETAAFFVGSGTMVMNITEGQLTQVGNHISEYQTLAANGQIIAYGGLGDVVVSYDDFNDVTIVTAVPDELQTPNDGFAGVALSTVLAWPLADPDHTYDVYMDTDQNKVINAEISFLEGDLTENGVVDVEDLQLMAEYWLTDNLDLVDFGYISKNWLEESTYKGRFDINSYDTGQLEAGVTYYWRVDEIDTVNPVSPVTGDVWSFTTCTGSAQTEYYVATDGNDLNPGTLASPFATIEKARDVLRNCCSRPSGAVTVWIRGGTYYLDSTLIFDQQDSGEPDKPITYKNYAGENPVLVGGELITGWTLDSGSIYKTYVGTGREFYCLFENGNRSTMARTPNSGYFATETRGDSYTEFGFASGDLSTFDYSDAQVYCWPGDPSWSWFSMTQPIVNIDWGTRTITLENGFASGYNLKTGNRYFVQGAKEFIDSPGEFYLDQSTGWLYYWPVSTPILDQKIVAATTKTLVQFKGVDSSTPVKNITLEGLELNGSDFDESFTEDAQRVENDKGYGLVVMENAVSNTVRNCKLANAGYDGILLEKYAQHNTIEGNFIENTGRHGVNLSGWFLGAGGFADNAASYVNKSNTVSNNVIHDVGRLVGHGCGITVYQSGDNEIAHNEISKSTRMGIYIIGFAFHTMGTSLYGESVTSGNYKNFIHSRNNQVAYNDVSDYGTDSQDLGGIYTWCPGTYNVINNNRVHDARSFGFCGGIYLDDQTIHTTVTNNIVHDIGSDYKWADLLVTKGDYNVAINNILAFQDTPAGSPVIQHEVSYGSSAMYATFERNILYQPSGRKMLNIDDLVNQTFASCDNNLYYHPGGTYEVGPVPTTFLGFPITSLNYNVWRSYNGSAYDQNSLTGTDPLFVDAANRNFDLQPGSPAFGLGIVDIDDASIGLKEDFPYFSKTCNWTASGSNELWSNGENWDIRVPNFCDDAVLNVVGSNVKIESETVTCASIFVGKSTGPVTLDVDSATVNTDERFNVGGYSGTGGIGTLKVRNNATINAGSLGMVIGKYGTGTLDMTSGTINTPYLWCPRTTGTGIIYLDGGTINITDASQGLQKYGTGAMDIDITAGVMIIAGDHVSTINTYVTNGWITAYNGSGTVNVDYDSIDDKTIISGNNGN